MDKDFKPKLITISVAILLLLLGIILFNRNGAREKGSKVENEELGIEQKKSKIENPELIPVDEEQFTKTYNSPNFGFSFYYPENYTVTAFDDLLPDGSPTQNVLVQDATNLQGFQIRISPFDEDIDITEERIMTDVPSLLIQNPQEVQIGPARKGLAFLSDNDAYGGASREVWFVFRGNLYQISTYASLDALLQQVLGTWQFQ